MRQLFFLVPLTLTALPTGFNCVQGEASLTELDPQSILIETHGRTIIHWDDFSIDFEEQVHIQQDSTQSAVLIRALDEKKSLIDSNLTSNGIIYIINPSGIAFFTNSYIETAGLFASTLDVLDEDFINGSSLLCSGDYPPLESTGTIVCNGSDVILVGGSISQGGAILLQTTSNPRTLIHPRRLEGMELEGPHLVAIDDPVESIIPAVEEEGGSVYLISNSFIESSGALSAPNGEIHCFAPEIKIASTATFDVSSNRGGGSIYIGGYEEGEDPLTEEATLAFLCPDSVLKADALASGGGGGITLATKGIAFFQGSISARPATPSELPGVVSLRGTVLESTGSVEKNNPTNISAIDVVPVVEIPPETPDPPSKGDLPKDDGAKLVLEKIYSILE